MSRKVNNVQFYRDRSGLWQWRIVAAENGEIIGRSSEGYSRWIDAATNFNRVTGITDVTTVLLPPADETGLRLSDESPDPQADEDGETDDDHAISFPADATLAGPLYCDFCGAAVVLDGFPEHIDGDWIHVRDWKAKHAEGSES